jgi:hypothetical protein
MTFATGNDTIEAHPRHLHFSTFHSPATGQASAEFSFKLEQGGRFLLAGLVRAAGIFTAKSDSFFVRVDDGERILWDLGGSPSFVWFPVQGRGETAPRVFQLGPGKHRILLEKREPDAELARLALVPETTPLPLAPDEPVTGAVRTFDTGDAVMKTSPFLLKPASEANRFPEVTTRLFPVHPTGGRVTTAWFETSREGAHPRLQYTVTDTDPRFLVVMIPRRPGMPCPDVSELPVKDGVGARLDWGSCVDVLTFHRADQDGRPRGTATFIRRFPKKKYGWLPGRRRKPKWILLDGTRLRLKGKTIFQATERGIYPPGIVVRRKQSGSR